MRHGLRGWESCVEPLVAQTRDVGKGHAVADADPPYFFFFFTLVTGPSRSLSLKLSGTRVYPTYWRLPEFGDVW